MKQDELERALGKVGFGDLRTLEVKVPFGLESAEAFAEFWFQAKNPAALRLIGDWPLERMEQAREPVMGLVERGVCGWEGYLQLGCFGGSGSGRASP